MRSSIRSSRPTFRRAVACGSALCGAVAAVAARSQPPITPPPPPPAYGPEKPDEPRAIWAPAAPGNFEFANRPVDRPITYVVIHDIEGPAEFAVRWFQNPQSQVSAHYTMDGRGKLWQQV